MAEQIADMRIDKAMGGGIGTPRNRVRMLRIGGIGLVAAALVVLLIAGMALHGRRASHTLAPVIPRVLTRAETRLIENNTTNLPNVVAPEIRPATVTREQRRLLEVNTTLFPNTTVIASRR